MKCGAGWKLFEHASDRVVNPLFHPIAVAEYVFDAVLCPTAPDEAIRSSVDDIEIRGTIRRDSHELDRLWCPHSATAAKVFRRLLARGARGHWVIVATAHPAKFNEIVEAQTGREAPLPDSLARLLALPRQETELDPTLDALRGELQKSR